MTSQEMLQPYGTLASVDKNLWVLDGEWFDTPFRRRMTIIKLATGDLVIHSAIRLSEGDYSMIDALGKVAYIVVPNTMHGDDAPFFKRRYPSAKLFVPKGAAKKMSKICAVDGVLPECWPKELESELRCFEFGGTRILEEQIFFHAPSKTLVVADLVFNMTTEPTGFMKTLFKWNKIYKRFGPSRIFRMVFIADAKKAERSFREVLAFDFDRVIMSHGDVLNSKGQAKLRESLKDIKLSV